MPGSPVFGEGITKTFSPGGLGTATGQLLHSQGAHLALLYAPFEASRRDQQLESGYGANPQNVKTYECDITSPESVDKVFSKIASESSSVPSILINAAGYVSTTPLETTPPEEITKHLTVNVMGPMLCSQSFARLYFAATSKATSSSPVAPGRIVSISSQAAHVALANHGAYCASKAALIGLTNCMASEWGGRGITANTVSPTVALTELGKKAWPEGPIRDDFLKTIPTGRFAMPDDIASAIVFLCRDESGMVNGGDVKVDGGFTIR